MIQSWTVNGQYSLCDGVICIRARGSTVVKVAVSIPDGVIGIFH
jgi:hypothetical protein